MHLDLVDFVLTSMIFIAYYAGKQSGIKAGKKQVFKALSKRVGEWLFNEVK